MQDPNSVPQDATAGRTKRHRVVLSSVAALVILGVGAWLTYFYRPGPDLRAPMFNWYTTDDGATWFQDDAERVPPYDHNGKPAVRLHLFSCDGGRTTFVGYLQKLPEETLAKYRAQGIDPETVDDDEVAGDAGWLAKRPGETKWVNSNDNPVAYLAVVRVMCPNERGREAAEVLPKNLPRGAK